MSWIQRLAENKKALERLEAALGNTLANEDGVIYPSIEDAAEAFVIVYLAYIDADQLSYLSDIVGEKDRFVFKTWTGHVEVNEEEDWFKFTPTQLMDKPTHLAIYAD